MIGVVLVARHCETKRLVCLKCMSLDKIGEKNLMRNISLECEIHYELADSPNILPLLQIITREQDIVMVFPYMASRDLFNVMVDNKKPEGHLNEQDSHKVFV